ncbi:energy transducer TonB [uncultured Methylobacterium sp.]|jgi:TonB family protein|uniref:energy transducer TonB family protein n=1 Tax=uncultured Methylobacterium sp. TaxID=157278 RepID=UPI002623B3E4|nr:energy transducer TonB [uncultured Methylobacterium sp.]
MNPIVARTARAVAAGMLGLAVLAAAPAVRAQGGPGGQAVDPEARRAAEWAVDTSRRIRSRLPASTPKGLASGPHVVKVRFTVDEQGRIGDPAVAESSGNPSLDRLALAAVRRASPVGTPPDVRPGGTRVAVQPITFVGAPRRGASRARERAVRPICTGCDR